ATRCVYRLRQQSFNVMTDSKAKNPGDAAILTVSAIDSIYTAEPVLIDFVVRNAENNVPISKTQVHVTVNGQSFDLTAESASLYLTGLKRGQNWLSLELQDQSNKLSSAPYSEQLFSFEFQPEESSAVGQLFAENAALDKFESIVNPLQSQTARSEELESSSSYADSSHQPLQNLPVEASEAASTELSDSIISSDDIN
ncbi:MAG: hypothetical protein AAGB01_08920, partial [Cyanobacteria bacterium P01_F01_bin.42]